MVARGQAFIFLDGLDEVPEDARRSLRDAFIAGVEQFPLSHWLLTSRIVGYSEVPYHRVEDGAEGAHGDDFRGFHPRQDDDVLVRSLARFYDDRIRDFSTRWYSCREPSTLAAGKDAELVEAIHAGADDYPFGGIRSLAGVPSMLALMALVHRVDATLPHQRTVLYDRITAAYLESIDRSRGLTSGAHDLPHAMALLGRVGYEMQRRRAHMHSDDFRFNVVDAEDLIAWIDDELDKDRAEAPYSAKQFLSFITRRSGLISPRGKGRFAFRDRSFQEYFAARAIEREVTGNHCAKRGRTSLGFSEKDFTSMASKPVWLEMFVFLFEMLTYQGAWHGWLLQQTFGLGFSKLEVQRPEAEQLEEVLNLSRLATRLAVNPHSRLAHTERDYIAKASIQAQFQYDSRTDPIDDMYWSDFDRPWSIYEMFLDEDPDRGVTIIVESIADTVRRVQYPRLILPYHNVDDVDFIAKAGDLPGLTSLKMLVLDDSGVQDLKPLAPLQALESLELRRTKVCDISPLAGLASLKKLDLSETCVRDINPNVALSTPIYRARAAR